jgi:segregation and condensation protein B
MSVLLTRGFSWPGHRRLPQNHRLPALYRYLNESGSEPLAADAPARDNRVALAEAALFAADEPLTARRLAIAIGCGDGNEARRIVRKLQSLLDQEGSAFQVEEVAGGFQLLTRPEYHPWLVRMRRGGTELRLSPAARETLAIVAYRQPIMRADVEAIRGVQVNEVLRLLMERGLIRIAGRDNSLGRPVLYGTTKKFLQMFGLKGLRDLPMVEQFQPPEKKTEAAEDAD